MTAVSKLERLRTLYEILKRLCQSKQWKARTKLNRNIKFMNLFLLTYIPSMVLGNTFKKKNVPTIKKG